MLQEEEAVRVGDVIGRCLPERQRGLIDGLFAALDLDEHADRCLIHRNHHLVCGEFLAIFFVAKPHVQAEFFEDRADVPVLLDAWVRGYRRVGSLSAEEESEIETFVMLRRLLLVAWIGSHSETELAQSMGIAYTQGTLPLCERYLSRFGEASRHR